MHHDFTTLFYVNYAAKGVALCRSLIRVCVDCHLYVFAMDDECYKLLQNLSIPNTTIIPLADLEVYCNRLSELKKDRDKGEFSWTCKGPSMLYCIEKFGLKSITYLDADLYFLKDPTPLYLENMDADVMLTDHRYTARYNLSNTNGKYCAGYMYFKATENGLKILRWWTEMCLEWCYCKHERGRFGDQKYLDFFHERFDNVHDIRHIGFCAPWNIQQYIVGKTNNGLKVKLGDKIDDLIFYHYHFVKNQNMGIFNELYLGPYSFDKSVIKYIYKPYLKEIEKFSIECDNSGINSDVLASNVCVMNWLQLCWHWVKNCWKPNKFLWKRK